MCWVCLAFFVFVLVLLSLQADTREALIASPVWFVLLGIGYLWKGRRASHRARRYRSVATQAHPVESTRSTATPAFAGE
ncbi:hypothetical protein RLIN73S_01979 [Rhodanobacter lindaniclasticus]